MSKILFKRLSNVNSRKLSLCLHLANIADFDGHFLVTSTNPNLEGTYYKNWWKFANQQSVDATLHSKCNSNYLIRESQKAAIKKFGNNDDRNRLLPFGECIVTDAGPKLKVNRIIHTCVPVHPQSSIANDGRPIPPALHQNFACNEIEALELLKTSYHNIFAEVLMEWRKRDWNYWMRVMRNDLNELKICVPAIGCGYNGYPIKEAAEIALNAVLNVENSEEDMVIEFRLLHLNVFQIWEQVVDESKSFERICDSR